MLNPSSGDSDIKEEDLTYLKLFCSLHSQGQCMRIPVVLYLCKVSMVSIFKL